MYRPIGDYGLIGNCRSVALVSKEGSIDYCCMPAIDSPAVFAAILDDEKGGRFAITPRQPFTARQAYLRDTAILVTSFETNSGVAELTDFMVMESGNDDRHSIHRCLQCTSGTVAFTSTLSARPDFAKASPVISRKETGFSIESEPWVFGFRFACPNSEELSEGGADIVIRFLLHAGEEAHFEFCHGCGPSPAQEQRGYRDTLSFWRAWAERPGVGLIKDNDHVSGLLNRSLITLKLLSYGPAGSFAAAATTSLPEALGGSLNWDYRYCWIRDSAFTIKAFYSMGHVEEVERFIGWLQATFLHQGSSRLHPFYTLSGTTASDERSLDHLKGYRSSRPVLVGNSAWRQDQWDIYGEALNSLFEISKAQKYDELLWPFCREVCDLAIANWDKPDNGIWEKRGGNLHYVYSKVMCWVAIERGIEIAKRHGHSAPLAAWHDAAARIKRAVMEQGYNAEIGSFVSHFGSKELDASLLRLPLVGFLPIGDGRIQGTIDACKRQLMELGFLRRYRQNPQERQEGAFVLCSFWLVQCLALSGRVDEAEEHLATALRAANHLGLFSEMFDVRGGFLLGNFPQGYSHIGLINAVHLLRSAKANRRVVTHTTS